MSKQIILPKVLSFILGPLLISMGLLTCICTTIVSAEESIVSLFTTDRPGVGDTAYLVPSGYVQFEGGVPYQHDRVSVPLDRISTVSAPNTLIRVGIFDAMELRFLGGEYVYQKISSGSQDNHDHGVSHPTVGTKLQISKEGRHLPQTAIFLN